MATSSTGGPLWLAKVAVTHCFHLSPGAVDITMRHGQELLKCICWDGKGLHMRRDANTGATSYSTLAENIVSADQYFTVNWYATSNYLAGVLHINYRRDNELEVRLATNSMVCLNQGQAPLPLNRFVKLKVGDRLLIAGAGAIEIMDVAIRMEKMMDPVAVALRHFNQLALVIIYLISIHYLINGYMEGQPSLLYAITRIYPRVVMFLIFADEIRDFF